MKRILIVEDDSQLHELIETLLADTYQTVSAYSGTEALLLLKQEQFDLILLDMMLPGLTGDQLLLKIREHMATPVIILTAMQDKKIVSQSLLNGADDYLTKPFDVDELLARISVQLRRNPVVETTVREILAYKEIELNLTTFQLTRQSESLDLSKKEAAILTLLIEQPKKVYTKEALYEQVWQESYYGDENTINVHISNLRKKLALLDPDNTYIETVWGIGVKLSRLEGQQP